MEILQEKYARIKDSLPVRRGNVSLTNRHRTAAKAARDAFSFSPAIVRLLITRRF